MKIKNRYTAFLAHLLISLGILACLLFIIFFFWFPRDFIYAGGMHGLKILTGVDLVLGPLLTLVVFNPKKKSLRFDLSAIAVFQMTCMAIGLWLIYEQRPLVQLFGLQGIHIVSAYDFKEYDVKQDGVKALPGAYPKYAVLDVKKVLSAGEKPYYLRTEDFLTATDLSEEKYQLRLGYIKSQLLEKQKKQIESLVVHDDCTWVPVSSSHLIGYACINRENGAIKLKKVED